MLMRTIRLSTSLLLSLLLCAQVPAQAPSPSEPQATAVLPDPKRAHKAAERGGKAEAAGRFEEALAAYEEAARYARRMPPSSNKVSLCAPGWFAPKSRRQNVMPWRGA